MRWHCGTLFGALAVVAGLAGGCKNAPAPGLPTASDPASPPASLPPPPAVRQPGADIVYHEVGRWSGRGDRQTDSFDVTTGALDLRWEARETTPGAGRLRVTLHSAISGRPLQTVLDIRGGGGADVYFEDEPRVSYLVIESAGVDWKLELFQAAAGGRLAIPGHTK